MNLKNNPTFVSQCKNSSGNIPETLSSNFYSFCFLQKSLKFCESIHSVFQILQLSQYFYAGPVLASVWQPSTDLRFFSPIHWRSNENSLLPCILLPSYIRASPGKRSIWNGDELGFIINKILKVITQWDHLKNNTWKVPTINKNVHKKRKVKTLWK